MPDDINTIPINSNRRAPVIAANQNSSIAGGTSSAGEEHQSPPGGGAVTSGQRAEAERYIRDIGVEFNKLRKRGRSAAWASLEEKVAEAGALLISTGMITSKDWVGMLIDIEQFRKSEGGSEELPGDALAKWLSEPAAKKRVAT
jgi:hypothetical protein